MASQTPDRFKPVALAYSAPSHQHQTERSPRQSYAISFQKPDPANPPSRVTGEFVGCDLAWDESGHPFVSATVNGTPVPPGALRVRKPSRERGRISTTFTLDLPGGAIAPKIRVVIETTPLPYGQRCETTPSLVLTLDSKLSIVCQFDPPPVFYNAFPDLNGVAEDGSYSAPPVVPKYMLPLDCIYNPYATFVELNESHPLAIRPIYQQMQENFKDTRAFFVAVPRERELAEAFHTSHGFEEAHARLGASWYKLMFRADLLGPFYNTLWDWISKKRTIRVPLLRNPDGSALQRQWHRIRSWFEETCLLDESCSLLVQVAYITDTQQRKRDEAAWEQAEDQEMRGKFAPFYRNLRSAVECLYGGSLDACRTENERLTFAEVAIACCSMVYNRVAETGIADPQFFPDTTNAWPRTPLNAFRERLPHRFARWGEVPVMLGLQLIGDEEQHCFMDEPSFGPNAHPEVIQMLQNRRRNRQGRQYIAKQYFISQSDVTSESVCFVRVAHGSNLIPLLAFSTSAPPSDPRERQRNEIAAGVKVLYTIFLESIRQQLCQGVGLRCPFWNGECCQRRGFYRRFRELLQQTYTITKPLPWLWPQHWQKPPCLDA